ncbi:MAG TPA: serine/threonine-protein kinase [Thermoanaerobaculia bacterium]|nr:serine/threonine-protein kinase [Thermoanaerobaculia bacterium]
MTPEDDRCIADIFEQAVDLPPAERGDFVERACGDDATVRREVEALLALDAEAEAGALGVPERVGPYRLAGKLGEGGMSEVFLGLRDDGEFVRRVAVKLIRKEFLTAETMRRFETERQILASLDHPSIARLLDAGRTADGMPYFVMEYIEGEPIDLYCDRHRLTVAERLEIFRQVCLAVHFAHQNLVVHRDIKPGNILVTEAGQPKLLDFGIAKLLNPDLMIRGSEPTMSWGRLLTPEYASPEQLLGKPVTSASDVYALGVLLFKLLTGADPYRLRERPAPELERSILAAEPDTPSGFVRRLVDAGPEEARELAMERGTRPHALVRAFAGDLDAITAKALRKEPQHRYVSAEQMAEDLRRHLAGGPVSAPYRTTSLPTRGWLLAGAALTLLLLAAAGLLARQKARLEERDQARTQQIVASLERVFEEMPLGPHSQDLVDHASRRFQQDLAGIPDTQAGLMMSLGRVYFRMGHLEEAASSFQGALATRQRLFGVEHEAVAESLAELAVVEATQGDLQGAEDLHARALAIRRKIHPGDNFAVTESLVGLGRVFLAKGHAAIAEPLLQEAFVTRQRLLGEGDVRVAEPLTDLGHAVGLLGSPDAADFLFMRAAKIQRRAAGDETWEVAINLVYRAASRVDQGEREKGREILLEASRIERQLCGEASPDLAGSLLNFAAAAQQGTPWADPVPHLRPAASDCRTPPLAAPHLPYLLQALGTGLNELGYAAEAEPLLEQAGEIRWPATPPPPADNSSAAGPCVPDGGIAETLESHCCSGVILGGTTVCRNPAEWGNSWRTCRHVCGSRLVNGCVPPGGVDDILSLTNCCNGASVNGSVRCLNPADHGTTWRTCFHTCA